MDFKSAMCNGVKEDKNYGGGSLTEWRWQRKGSEEERALGTEAQCQKSNICITGIAEEDTGDPKKIEDTKARGANKYKLDYIKILKFVHQRKSREWKDNV